MSMRVTCERPPSRPAVPSIASPLAARLRRLAVPALLCLPPLALAAPAGAQGTYRRESVFVTFAVDADAAPTHACFVFRSRANSAGEHSAAGYLRSDARASVQLSLTSILDATPPDSRKPLLRENAYEWRVDDLLASEKGSLGYTLPRAAAAPGGEMPSCAQAPAAHCAPSFRLSQEWMDMSRKDGADAPKKGQGARLPYWFICTRDLGGQPSRAADGEASRVVVLGVEMQKPADTAPMAIEPKLNGTVASFKLSGPKAANLGKNEDLTIRVLGGSYLETTDTGVNDEGRVRLALTPRCQPHVVELPPSDKMQPRYEAALSIGGRSEGVHRCIPKVLSSDRRFLATLPNVASGETKYFEVVESVGDDARFQARFVQEWSTRVAPEVLKPRVRMVAFAWNAPCMYPDRHTCPAAKIDATGLECHGSWDPERSQCSYQCPGPRRDGVQAPPLDFELPVRVRFRRTRSEREDESWDDTLAYAGQVLTGYVPSSEQYVEVDLSRWATPGEVEGVIGAGGGSAWLPLRWLFWGAAHRREGSEGVLHRQVQRPAAVIGAIVLRDSRGGEHHVVPGLNQRVSVPGARCGDRLAYDIESERPTETAHVEVRAGSVTLVPPESRETRWTAHLSLGGGISARLSGVPVGYASPRFRPFGALRAGLTLRPRGAPFAFEPTFGYAAGEQSYFPLRFRDGVTIHSRSVPYQRFGLEMIALWHPPCGGGDTMESCRLIAVGLGAGALIGTAIRAEDQLLIGPPQVVPTLSTLLRFYFSPMWSFQMITRLGIDEKQYRLTSDFAGSVGAAGDPTPFLQIDMGLRWGP